MRKLSSRMKTPTDPDEPASQRRNPEVEFTLDEYHELMDKARALGFDVDSGELDHITLTDLEILVNRKQ